MELLFHQTALKEFYDLQEVIRIDSLRLLKTYYKQQKQGRYLYNVKETLHKTDEFPKVFQLKRRTKQMDLRIYFLQVNGIVVLYIDPAKRRNLMRPGLVEMLHVRRRDIVNGMAKETLRMTPQKNNNAPAKVAQQASAAVEQAPAPMAQAPAPTEQTSATPTQNSMPVEQHQPSFPFFPLVGKDPTKARVSRTNVIHDVLKAFAGDARGITTSEVYELLSEEGKTIVPRNSINGLIEGLIRQGYAHKVMDQSIGVYRFIYGVKPATEASMPKPSLVKPKKSETSKKHEITETPNAQSDCYAVMVQEIAQAVAKYTVAIGHHLASLSREDRHAALKRLDLVEDLLDKIRG